VSKIIKRVKHVPGTVRESDLWRTPRAVFDKLHEEFVFDLDLAADADNHLLPRYLGVGGLAPDALAVRWADVGKCGFLNPPYSAELIRAFMRHVTAQAEHGFTTVCLVPNSISTRWWVETRWAVEIREIERRVPYLRSDGITIAGAMFDSVVVVYRPQPGIVRGQPRRVVWTWREPKTTPLP
jgi:phage N-6-adenine-methyltransferase